MASTSSHFRNDNSPENRPSQRPGSYTATVLALLTLVTVAAATGLGAKEKSPYRYASADDVVRHFAFVTDQAGFNATWEVTVPSILSRQLENGLFIESTRESNLYPHAFPRNVFPDILLRSGYFDEIRRYLDFMWKNQKKDGSFWNYFDQRGKGAGIVEEDGGAYIIWQTYRYYLHTKDIGWLRSRWNGVVRAIEFLDGLRDEKLGLFYSTAGYSEGKITGGYNVYHQAIAFLAYRSAARIAEVLGKTDEADHCREIVQELPVRIREHLYDPEKGRFVFQLRRDGTVNDKPYPAFLILSYYHVFSATDELLARTIDYVRNGPLYGEYSADLFGFEGIDVERTTGSGFWIGQAGHGWYIPYLLERGELERAGRWFNGLAAARDPKTNLIPEHINWAGFDENGGAWKATGDVFGVLPSPSAWVDPGNLYSMGTAMRVVFFIVNSDMEGRTPAVTLRVPASVGSLSAANIQTPAGYADLLYEREAGDGDIEVTLSGDGEGVLRILFEGDGPPAVSRDGEAYDHVSLLDSPPAVEIRTDFTAHTFRLSWDR
jgi:hypothetical protein